MDFHQSKRFGYLSSQYKAYLMVELLVACAIVLVIMQALIPLLNHQRQQMLNKTQLLDRMDLEAAVVDHFQSQLQPILWRACGLVTASSMTITIGSSEDTLPARIANKDVAPLTDWLVATERAACHYSVRIPSLTFSIPYSCSWDAGDDIVFEACELFISGTLDNVTGTQTSVRFSEPSLINEMGIIVGHNPYFWFVTENDDYRAFWRTPQFSGNSLELWAGIEKLAIYPLLDTDGDGRFDTLSATYQTYPLNQLTGFWLELIVKDLGCQTKEDSDSLIYKNHRSVNWSYDAKCDFPIQFVVGI